MIAPCSAYSADAPLAIFLFRSMSATLMRKDGDLSDCRQARFELWKNRGVREPCPPSQSGALRAAHFPEGSVLMANGTFWGTVAYVAWSFIVSAW